MPVLKEVGRQELELYSCACPEILFPIKYALPFTVWKGTLNCLYRKPQFTVTIPKR